MVIGHSTCRPKALAKPVAHAAGQEGPSSGRVGQTAALPCRRPGATAFFGIAYVRRNIFQGPRNRIALGIRAAQEFDTPLRPRQGAIGLTQESHAFLVSGQRIVQADLTLFQQAHDLLQTLQRLLETGCVGRFSGSLFAMLNSPSGFQEVAKSAAILREAAPSGRKPLGITRPHLETISKEQVP